ncbi:hypothetical protein [Photobacterium satsumensis]|uniref:hypothetical protein n=1 Tax=Photobacterium satsumensis TaxID=2910239 RepID=UPI003D139EE9
MTVNFNILKGNISWTALIHQLNSNLLLNHVLLKGNVDNHNIQFSYCEETCEGKITNSKNEIVGNFVVSA